MNPGIGEELGQVSRTAIGAMASAPVMLGVLLLNVVLMAFIFFAVQKARDYEAVTRSELTKLLTQCFVKTNP